MKTVILGFDAFDPVFFERLFEQGKLPHLSRYVQSGGYARLQVSNPPQSEVSWTSIATGLNPGGHGLFDFVHRNPKTYNLHVSLLPTKQGIGGTQFVQPYSARTLFDQAANQGYPATVLWWPATFPARLNSPVHTLPGLGTPDIHGRLGVGTLLTSDSGAPERVGKTPIFQIEPVSGDRFLGNLFGPVRKTRKGQQETSLQVEFFVVDEESADLRIGDKSVKLTKGKWSPILDLTFNIGWFVKVHTLTRFIWTQSDPEIRLYALPLQLNPLHSPWRYASPSSFVKDVWKNCGPFLTLGWPQDTIGLEDGCISDKNFLDLCEDIYQSRVCTLHHQLRNFQEGVLAVVFDSLDRIQHMFWKDRPDIIEMWYLKLDTLVGDVEQWLRFNGHEDARIVIVSDHGFADFDYKVHLNHWLVQKGYLKTHQGSSQGSLKEANWSETKAYAIGLNSLYLNLEGRESQGVVPVTKREVLLAEIRKELEDWRGPHDKIVVQKAYLNDKTFDGHLSQYGPDLVIGWSSGFRASQKTGLGEWSEGDIEPNRDHWGADHCIDPQNVPGVIFTNHDLGNYPHPSYRDIPAITIDAEPDDGTAGTPPVLSDQDDADVEERLKSLGYL